MPPRTNSSVGSLSSPWVHVCDWDSAEDWRGGSTRACEGRSDPSWIQCVSGQWTFQGDIWTVRDNNGIFFWSE